MTDFIEFCLRGGADASRNNFIPQSRPNYRGLSEIAETDVLAPCSCLTFIIEALEAFKEFEPEVRAAAITLRANELGVSRLHFYAIALYAGLGGER